MNPLARRIEVCVRQQRWTKEESECRTIRRRHAAMLSLTHDDAMMIVLSTKTKVDTAHQSATPQGLFAGGRDDTRANEMSWQVDVLYSHVAPMLWIRRRRTVHSWLVGTAQHRADGETMPLHASGQMGIEPASWRFFPGTLFQLCIVQCADRLIVMRTPSRGTKMSQTAAAQQIKQPFVPPGRRPTPATVTDVAPAPPSTPAAPVATKKKKVTVPSVVYEKRDRTVPLTSYTQSTISTSKSTSSGTGVTPRTVAADSTRRTRQTTIDGNIVCDDEASDDQSLDAYVVVSSKKVTHTHNIHRHCHGVVAQSISHTSMASYVTVCFDCHH